MATQSNTVLTLGGLFTLRVSYDDETRNVSGINIMNAHVRPVVLSWNGGPAVTIPARTTRSFPLSGTFKLPQFDEDPAATFPITSLQARLG